ncbi:unnamed protein product [Aspergillus oryzae]|uniref:Unnamed protein product n=1 Tax=Aspergillus oryzae TaxID=5062 RepID=A0AAN4YAU8_ASPOZ|nr:unnamed protein product [Aspergillus oryzae]
MTDGLGNVAFATRFTPSSRGGKSILGSSIENPANELRAAILAPTLTIFHFCLFGFWAHTYCFEGGPSSTRCDSSAFPSICWWFQTQTTGHVARTPHYECNVSMGQDLSGLAGSGLQYSRSRVENIWVKTYRDVDAKPKCSLDAEQNRFWPGLHDLSFHEDERCLVDYSLGDRLDDDGKAGPISYDLVAEYMGVRHTTVVGKLPER